MLEDIVGQLWFQLTLLLTVAIASSLLFAKFKQPKIIGQILLGIVIGPSLLGLISVDSDTPGSMVPRFAELGAIMLLFLIGLECDIKEIYTKRSLLIGAGGVIVPWVCGYFLSELMLPDPGVGYDMFSQSVFVGAALVATSVAITAGVLKEMGIIGSDIAKTLLGAAVVDDVLGMLVLAVSAGTASGEGIDLSDLTWLVTAAVLFVALGGYIGAKVLTKVVASVQRRGSARGLEESGFLMALSIALLYATISEAIGLSAIVGAFVAGTIFARCEYRTRFHGYTKVLEWVFAPIFFLSLGVLIDVGEVSSGAWLFALVLTGVAFATKIAGCGIPARLLGMSKGDSLSLGIGMSPRMEIAMVIALYGLSNKIITGEIYSVIVMMGLLTAVFTPSILRRTMRSVPKTPAVCETVDA
ncbi:MAG: hypothetical protein A3K67_05985 [Euryarchaeota archaeon RBG_16_62_10]|nr:MAG: hypothetical protein A3K67_05985 [Euryarchaeota archaeon RBG_16_62_10]